MKFDWLAGGENTWNTMAVSQFQEREEWTCVIVETSLFKLPWKNELGEREDTERTHLRIEMYCVLA